MAGIRWNFEGEVDEGESIEEREDGCIEGN